jgi:hypothetical protein
MKLGWAFFTLVVIATAAYTLNRGVYVGSRVGTFTYATQTKYVVRCRYLFPSGISVVSAKGDGIGNTLEQAENSEWFCPFFQPSF